MMGAKELWKSSAPPKVKFFFWLALHGRLWTADRRKRHGLQDSDACALCNQSAETIDHLFVACVYTRDRETWWRVLHRLQLDELAPALIDELRTRWFQARARLPGAMSKAFDSLVLLVTWCIWKERNRRVFDGVQIQASLMLEQIALEGSAWVDAGFKALALLLAWHR